MIESVTSKEEGEPCVVVWFSNRACAETFARRLEKFKSTAGGALHASLLLTSIGPVVRITVEERRTVEERKSS